MAQPPRRQPASASFSGAARPGPTPDRRWRLCAVLASGLHRRSCATFSQAIRGTNRAPHPLWCPARSSSRERCEGGTRWRLARSSSPSCSSSPPGSVRRPRPTWWSMTTRPPTRRTGRRSSSPPLTSSTPCARTPRRASSTPLLHHPSVAFAQPFLPLLDPLPAVDAVSLLPSPALLPRGSRSHLLLAARVDERAEGRHASSRSRSFLTAVAPFRGPTRVALARIGQGKGGRGGVAERTAGVGRPR